MPVHPNYLALVEKSAWCHAHGRTSESITAADSALARLYSYAFRLHTIGTFHATRIALAALPATSAESTMHRRHAMQTLQDLADFAMDEVPNDFRALISTFHRYHQGIDRVIVSLTEEARISNDADAKLILARFQSTVDAIQGCGGIHLTQDTHAPEQASFVVPSLGITIVPLVYGDHHSFNLAWLGGKHSDVPSHRHHEGVEIHLGYSPLRGYTILGDRAAEVSEGYAMPIPPQTRHGFTNASEMDHHVPFIFGSLTHGGWGVFLDVKSQPTTLDDLTITPRDDAAFKSTISLEREIAAARSGAGGRRVLIDASVTQRGNVGGLELSITRVRSGGVTIDAERFLAFSVVGGRGVATIAGVEQAIAQHDHFALPAGLSVELRQIGDEPLVLLDAAIR